MRFQLHLLDKHGTKTSVRTEGKDNSRGCLITGANRHDFPLLGSTLELLSRFAHLLPKTISIRLESGTNNTTTRESLQELGRNYVNSSKNQNMTGRRPIQETVASADIQISA